MRLSGLILLTVAALWPRSHDRSVLGGAPATHFAATTAARLEIDDTPRIRAAKVAVAEGDEPELIVDNPALTN